jgi:hypothetical protein
VVQALFVCDYLRTSAAKYFLDHAIPTFVIPKRSEESASFLPALGDVCAMSAIAPGLCRNHHARRG